MAYTPPQGAKKRELAEFWKPDALGETIIGKIVRFDDGGEFGPTLTMEPAIIVPFEGKPEAYAGLALGINGSLKKRVNPLTDLAKFFAIVYEQDVTTPKGSMRAFEVYELTRDQFAEEMKGARKSTAKPKPAAQPDALEEDDDLPF